MIGVNNNKADNLNASIKKYSEYAAKLLNEIPAQYRTAAQDGAIAIEEFTGEADEKTLEAIKKYREWAQKVADTKQQVEELNSEIKDLAKQKFDNIAQEFDSMLDITGRHTEQYEAMVSLVEESGNIAAPDYYNAMITEATKDRILNEGKKKALQETLAAEMAAGRIVEKDEKWYEMVNAIYDADIAIKEAVTDIEKFQNSINDIYWDNFDELINRLGYLKDETQSLIDLMKDEDMFSTPESDDGWNADAVQWTDEGMAALGLYAQKMEISAYETQQYSKAIEDLNKDYAAGKYSESEYLEKLDDLTSKQYASIKAYNDSKDAIVACQKARVDEIKNGINKQIEAYEELIDKKKEELSVEKDLYDFQKQAAESSKNIADIERKLAALAGDNSASAIAKRKQLEAELAEARSEQEELYYERSIENQQNALDKELEDFKEQKDAEVEVWEKYLEDVETVVTDSLELIQTNASEIYDTIQAKADEFGLAISQSILTPWQDGANAVADYNTTFGTLVSSTTSQLDVLKSKWQEVIDKMVEAAGAEIAAQKTSNANIGKAPTSTPTTKAPSTTNNSSNTTQAKTISVGGKINAGSAKIYADSYGGGMGTQLYSNDPIYVVLDEQRGYLKVRHHKLSSGVTGWFKKSDVKAYAKGTTGVYEDQWALIDELGEELVLNAGPDGRLQYLSKGSSVLTHDLTERLMDLAMNPQEMLDRNRPQITPSKSIVNTEINLDCSVGTLVNIEHCDQNTLPDVEKIVKNAFEKHVQNLNNSLKRFAR